MSRKGPASKIVTISYGIFNNPHQGRIQGAIAKWSSKGYTLHTRQEHPVGCLSGCLSLGLARGKTELTFVRQ